MELSELKEILNNKIKNFEENKKNKIKSFIKEINKNSFEKNLCLEKIVDEYYIKVEYNKNKTSYIYIAEIFEK